MNASAPSAAPASPRERALVLFSVVFATAAYAGTQTIANVALPQMQGDLSAGIDQITWVVTANIVASAIGIPPTGWLAARFGRKRLLLMCVAAFTLASALCAVAGDLQSLVLWRFCQGLFGAPLIPLSQAITLDTYPKKSQGVAIAVWSVGVVVGPVVAPALGGYLTDAYGWRSVFLVSVPLGVLSLAVCYALVPGDRAGNAPRFDWFGFIALSIGLAGIQMILSRGQRLDWLESTEIVVLVGVVVVALYVFTVHIATAANTFLNLRLFLDRNFSTGILIMFAYSHMILAPLVLIPTMLESLRGLEAVTIGVLLLPRGLGQITGLLISGWLVHRIDPRALLLAGFLAHAWSTWVMAGYTLGIGVWEVVWPGVVQGLAMGMIFVPAITLTFATLDPALRTEGAAIFSLTRNFGTSIGVSLAVTLLARSVQVSHARLAEHAVPGNELLSLAEYADGWDLADVEGLAAIERAITEQATMIAYVNVYWSMTVFALAVIPLIFLVRGVPRSR